MCQNRLKKRQIQLRQLIKLRRKILITDRHPFLKCFPEFLLHLQSPRYIRIFQKLTFYSKPFALPRELRRIPLLLRPVSLVLLLPFLLPGIPFLQKLFLHFRRMPRCFFYQDLPCLHLNALSGKPVLHRRCCRRLRRLVSSGFLHS